MKLQDRLAAHEVRKLDGDATVEAAGSQKRRVEHVGLVRRGEHDDALVVVEAVHLGQELVQRLLALVVRVDGDATLLADGVDFVDEHDARGLLVRLLEEVAHLRGTAAHEHLDELGARDLEERHVRLAGDRLGEQRLARARRADEQRAARAAGADGRVLLGVGEEVHDLLQRLLRLVLAGDVLERDAGLLALDLLGVGAAETSAHAEAATEVHGGAVVAHLLAEPPVQEVAAAEDEHYREDVAQDHVQPQAVAVVGNLGRELHAGVAQALHEPRVVRELRGLVGHALLVGREPYLAVAGVQLDGLHVTVVHHVDELAVAHLLYLGLRDAGIQVRTQADCKRDGDDQVHDHRLSLLLVVHIRPNRFLRTVRPPCGPHDFPH